MLRLEDVVIQQGSFRLEADLSLPPRSRTALIGPSGAGKSTLLAAISGFVALARGSVLVGGEDITNQPPGARPLSVIFQDGNLFPHMTAAQNVGLGIRSDLKLNKADLQQAEAALDRVGMPGLGDRKPANLSGGQKSRIALARVLVQRKPLILLDEPFAALGPALKREMLDLVADLCDETGATLLMVTHEPEDARRICDLTVVVADGTATTPTETAHVFANPPEALERYLGQA